MSRALLGSQAANAEFLNSRLDDHYEPGHVIEVSEAYKARVSFKFGLTLAGSEGLGTADCEGALSMSSSSRAGSLGESLTLTVSALAQAARVHRPSAGAL